MCRRRVPQELHSPLVPEKIIAKSVVHTLIDLFRLLFIHTERYRHKPFSIINLIDLSQLMGNDS